MKFYNLMSAMALLASASGAASATDIVEFDEMNVAAYYGRANTGTGCTVGFNCYIEKGKNFILGTSEDIAGGFTHLHRGPKNDSGDSLQHHADAAGIYGKRADFTAFSFDSFDALELSGDNGGIFNIVAFSEAVNTDIIGFGVDYSAAANYLGQQTVNAKDLGTVTLDDVFRDIKAFAIFYDEYNYTPSDGTTWDIVIDNVTVSDVSAVPVPAAAYLFATGLIGLVSFGRKRASQLTA